MSEQLAFDAIKPNAAVLANLSKSHHNIFPTYNNNNSLNKRKFSLKREPLLFIIMRFKLKALLLILIGIVLIVAFFIMRCSDFIFSHTFVQRWDRKLYEVNNVGNIGNDLLPAGGTGLPDIECLINHEYTVTCKHESDEVYVPFTFLRNYYDINGMLIGEFSENGAKFHWLHSNSKINIPKGKYDSRGLFMYFENYNVEVRDRVKCISAANGVPVSTQWEKRGYFYPTQIAQFALSHYSKNLSEHAPRIRVLEDADANQQNWTILPKVSNLTRIWHPKFSTNVVQYEIANGFESDAIELHVGQMLDLVLSVDLLLVTNSSSLIVVLKNCETQHTYRLHYIPADLLLSVQQDNVYYGLGSSALNKWRHLTRDLLIDLQKGIASTEKRSQTPTKIRRSELRVMSIAFLGIGFFDNITLSTYDHLAHFYDGAEWFVNNQNEKTGGWPNPVKRSLSGFAELRAGWLSAMGQGHAISVLARAFWHSGGDKRYLRAAALGLKPFSVYANNGGVLAQFMDKYYWYEEYPTRPASFVLNGFIYALLGLYDLNATAPTSIAAEAGELFSQGMQSLKKMLLLYDTGSGTSYDLRHLSLGIAPNLARWDYHATHVNQLLLLATIDSDPIIARTAERWKGYMLGKHAKHN